MNWWTDFYDDDYADLVLVGDDKDTDETLDALLALLDLHKPARWFDQCCGVGRWSVALAKKGHHLEGVDLMPGYVARANEWATQQGVAQRCHFAQGDARTYVPTEPCDVAMNWYTSFGYFEEDQHNMAMIQRCVDALKPGGVFILEVGNAARIIHTFLPCMTYRQPVDGGERLIVRECKLALETGMMHQQWTFVEPDGQQITRPTAIKLYQPHALMKMLRQVGLEEIRVHGGVDGSPLTLDSPRCLLIAKKPGTLNLHHQ